MLSCLGLSVSALFVELGNSTAVLICMCSLGSGTTDLCVCLLVFCRIDCLAVISQYLAYYHGRHPDTSVAEDTSMANANNKHSETLVF